MCVGNRRVETYVIKFGIVYVMPVCLFLKFAISRSSPLAEHLNCYECADTQV